MTAYDTRLRSLANRMILRFGTSATLIRANETFDDVTNKMVAGSPTNYPLTISPPTFAEIQEVDGERVLATDMFCFTPAANAGGTNIAGLPPNTDKDTLLFMSETYRLVGFNPIYSGDAVAAYELHLRK